MPNSESSSTGAPYSKGETSESWAFHNGHISLADYMKQADAFTAANYDPEYWAKLIKESGAKYTVITTKHHDGFALWDTKAGDVSSVKSSPAKRDVIGPFADAIRKQGDIKLGFYFSLIDWPRKDYPQTYRDKAPKYDIKADPKKWQHFLDFNNAQLTELSRTGSNARIVTGLNSTEKLCRVHSVMTGKSCWLSILHISLRTESQHTV